MLTITDILLRLGAAALIGSLIGLNRDLHGKPTGVRTLGLVGLGAAAIVVGAVESTSDPNITSRVMQGVLTGIGFLGAGVILRDSTQTHVQGLTTAACVWLTASLGLICGAGHWNTLWVAVPLIFGLLIAGGYVDKWLLERDRKGGNEPPQG